MKNSQEKMLDHIKTLMKHHNHKYGHISDGELKILDTLLTNQLLTIYKTGLSPSVTALLLTGTMNTILSLSISQEDLPTTFETLRILKGELK